MGTIRIDVDGSFLEADDPVLRRGPVAVTALDHGHAAAVGEAISYLLALLPSAVRLDHKLHSEGATPRDNFGLPS